MIGLFRSFSHALRGLRYAFFEERNFTLQAVYCFVVVVISIFLKVETLHFIIIVICFVFLLTLELVNTVVEKLIDTIHPRLHTNVGIIKDMMAAAVLLVALLAFIISIYFLGLRGWDLLFSNG